MSAVQSAAMKAGIGAAGVIILTVRMRASSKPLEWFGVRRPALYPALLFPLVYVAWMLGSDAVLHWRGPWDFRPWQNAPPIASALRVLAVCLLGPIVEELLFRGIIFSWLQDRIPTAVVIGITAISWALLHWSYTWAVIGVIVVDGLLLGAARARSRSVMVPIAMHILYNLYAIW